MKKLLIPLLITAFLLTGCSGGGLTLPSSPSGSVPTPPPVSSSAPSSSPSVSSPLDAAQLFSQRDFDIGYDSDTAARITLNGSSATCSSNAVKISGSTVTITDEGTYLISGTLKNGMIVVSAGKDDKTQIVLDNAAIHSESCAPIYVLQADKVFITLAPNSENSLSNGGTFTPVDENNIDSVIFSKEDLTLNGTGSLSITSPGGHGIVSKDALAVTGGTYTVSSAGHALTGKDSVALAEGSFTLTAGKDGIHAENNDDAALGHVYIQSGSFDITAEGDGISAACQMQIDSGTFDIVTGGGSKNASQQTSGNWGNMGGGMRPGGNMGGGGMRPGGGMMGRGTTSTVLTSTDDDSTSIKAIKAGGDMVLNGGTFTIDSADDSVHSNCSITVNAGSFTIAAGDDAFHADDTLSVNAGTIHISTSYEGLEALHITVAGGDISLKATDDGLNAAGGTDQSGLGGFRGGDQFGGGKGGMMGGMAGTSNGSILISGGSLFISASGDGIDANGSLTISGGHTVVCGPTTGDTATLDYDSSATITGGTFLGTGATGMAQTFSSSTQGVLFFSAGNQQAGVEITVTDKNGKVLISHTPQLNFALVNFSTPDLVSGETYTVTVGSASGSVTAK